MVRGTPMTLLQRLRRGGPVDTGEKEQRLRLVFATQEIVVRGHSLRRIETAMQRMELSHLACLPGSYRSLLADGQPFVREIVVQEVKDSGAKATTPSN